MILSTLILLLLLVSYIGAVLAQYFGHEFPNHVPYDAPLPSYSFGGGDGGGGGVSYGDPGGFENYVTPSSLNTYGVYGGSSYGGGESYGGGGWKGDGPFVGRVKIQVYRGPTQKSGYNYWAPWGYFVTQPRDQPNGKGGYDGGYH